tara:strand:- start:20447 stop:21505 length:1059 start_codon:yes stop_codon:yes gene_type:complete
MGFWSFIYGILPDVWFKGMTIRSYTGIMLVNSIRLRRRDRRLRRALKRLERKYTQDTIASLYKKYSSTSKTSPRRIRKFQKKLDKFVRSFLEDYIIFRSYYLDALQLISQSLLSNKRESKREITDIEALFADVESKRSELIFPMKEVEIFKGQVTQLLQDIARDIRIDEVSDIRVERGGYPVGVSVFSPKRWWSRAKAYRKERKEIKKLGKDLTIYDQLHARVLQELQTGVRQDFLFLLIEVFKRVDVADKRLEEIKQDLKLVLKRLGAEIQKVKNSLDNILKLLRNEPQIRNNPQFAKIEEEIGRLQEMLRQIVKQDFKNTEALREMLGILLEEGNRTMAEIEQQAGQLAA